MLWEVVAAAAGQTGGGLPSWAGPAAVIVTSTLTAVVGFLTWRSNSIAKRAELRQRGNEIRLNDFKFGFDTMRETLDATLEENQRLRTEVDSLRERQRGCDAKINKLAFLVRRIVVLLPADKRTEVYRELENVIGL